MFKKDFVYSKSFLEYFYIAIFINFVFINTEIYSNEITKSVNSFGLPGLIDMPIAGSFNDGELGFTSSNHGPNLRNTLTFQALPRVTAAFRYAGVGDKDVFFIKSGYANWDRSFDLRVDLLKQNKYLPDLTLGLQDFIGTGFYSAEYLVASKRMFSDFRFTFGLGWGRLSSRNSNVISKTGKRDTQTSSLGGTLNYNRFFKGDVASFGGVEYQTPLKKLKFKAEISSDDYSKDRSLSSFILEDPLNYGAEYNLNEAVNISAYYLNKSEIGMMLKISANPIINDPGNFMEPVPQPFYSFPIDQKDMNKSYLLEIKNNLNKEKISLISSKNEKSRQTVVIENSHYSTQTQAIGRTLRIMSRFVPMGVSEFTVVISEYGIPIVEITVNRNDVALLVDAPNAEFLTKKISKINSAKRVYSDTNVITKNTSSFDWSLYPYYRLHLFDPNKPLYYDLGPRLKLDYTAKPGLVFSGAIERSFSSTFNEIKRGVKGSLPKVRTQLKEYLNNLDTRINYLTANSYYKFSDNIFGRTTVGYLEPMYSGISTELLYAPISKSHYFGAEINYIKPREFKQMFGFREIDGMPSINGHLTSYWDTGYYYYKSQVDIGRYLAGDKGATITLTRDFPNGWKVGGFFTLTDASFSQFGEGSFDKGIFFRMPFNSLIPYETTGGVYEKIKPIQGDGGARVNVPVRLIHLINNNTKNRLSENWAKIWR